MQDLLKNVKQFVLELLNQLDVSSRNEKPKAILIKRFGLSEDFQKKLTLEEIGNIHGGITRERVRQIQDLSLDKIKGFPITQLGETAIYSIKEFFKRSGNLVSDKKIEADIPDVLDRNYLLFLLEVNDNFSLLPETITSINVWTTDVVFAKDLLQVLSAFAQFIEDDVLFPKEKVISLFSKFASLKLKNASTDPEMLLHYLSLSKVVTQNQFSEWGKLSSALITQKTIGDWAYYVLVKKKTSMHFRAITEEISVLAKEDVIIDTCHNRLIADERFILIGRGIYALKAWGHEKGSVIDVIKNILLEYKSLHKTTLIEKVLEKRELQKNTVQVALYNNKDILEKDKNGYITLKKID